MTPRTARHRWSYDRCRQALRQLAAHLTRTPSNRELAAYRRQGWDVPTEGALRSLYGSSTRGKADAGLVPNGPGGQPLSSCRVDHDWDGVKCRTCRNARLRRRYATDPAYRAAHAAKHKQWRSQPHVRARLRAKTAAYMRALRQREKRAILTHRTAA